MKKNYLKELWLLFCIINYYLLLIYKMFINNPLTNINIYIQIDFIEKFDCFTVLSKFIIK